MGLGSLTPEAQTDRMLSRISRPFSFEPIGKKAQARAASANVGRLAGTEW